MKIQSVLGLIVLIVVATFGFCIGIAVANRSLSYEAVKQGHAEYNMLSGEWQWKKVEAAK